MAGICPVLCWCVASLRFCSLALFFTMYITSLGTELGSHSVEYMQFLYEMIYKLKFCLTVCLVIHLCSFCPYCVVLDANKFLLNLSETEFLLAGVTSSWICLNGLNLSADWLPHSGGWFCWWLGSCLWRYYVPHQLSIMSFCLLEYLWQMYWSQVA